MPYPNVDAAESAYASETFARWDDLLKGIEEDQPPGPYDYTTKTRLWLGQPHSGLTSWDTPKWPLVLSDDLYAIDWTGAKYGGRLPVRGKIDFQVAYTLNGNVGISIPAGAKVFQVDSNGIANGKDLIKRGKLAYSLTENSTEIIVVFGPDPLSMNRGILGLDYWKPHMREPPSATVNLEIRIDPSMPSEIVPSHKIAAVKQTSRYTWTDYGTDVPTGDDAMGGTCTRGSGATRSTITCTTDGLPEYIMLEGDPDVVFDESTTIALQEYPKTAIDSSETTPTMQAIFMAQSRNACGNGMNQCDSCFDPECNDDADCYWEANSKCVPNRAPRIRGVKRYGNPSGRYAVCGVTTRIEGNVYINDLPERTKGFYLGGCSGSGVTSIDSRTWDSNNVSSTMTELILDDTEIVNPPDISSLVNLERLSISGDQYNGKMTALPNITSLTNLKFFNVSRQTQISVSRYTFSKC